MKKEMKNEMKLSEILKLSLPFHKSFGGFSVGMCFAIENAYNSGLFCIQHCNCAQMFCVEIVDELCLGTAYLHSALASRKLPHDEVTISQIWLAVIDKLESEGN